MNIYWLQWGGYLPPFHKYAIFLLCGFELFVSAMSMAVAQKYYELCTIIFPIAMYMFDDTKRREIEGFIWTDKERQILQNVCIYLNIFISFSFFWANLKIINISKSLFDSFHSLKYYSFPFSFQFNFRISDYSFELSKFDFIFCIIFYRLIDFYLLVMYIICLLYFIL